tara:strand:+ start:261 stop:968 length:708 start_codon:yes stop_codon:yes gene_type:complete
MKKINVVYETKNYNTFKFLDNNRDVNKKHINRLIQSMKEKRLISPILVNESGQIIDGQHRFEAQKKLGLSIPYIIQDGYGEKEAQRLNINSSNWTLTNWLNFYSRKGIKDYITYKEFKKKYKFENEQCSQLLSGGYSRDVFVGGFFKVKDYNKAVKYAEMIWEIKPYFKYITDRMFVRAILDCFGNKEYKHSQFLKKLRWQGNSLMKCRDKKDYLRLIEEIYNRKNMKTNKIRLF